MIPIFPVICLVLSIIATIYFIVLDNIQWQEKLRKDLGVKKKKTKLKKGQQIVFQEKEDVNPFEETI